MSGDEKPKVRLLKNARLLRYARLPALRRTLKYASFLESSQASHPGVFDQPEIIDFFKCLIGRVLILVLTIILLGGGCMRPGVERTTVRSPDSRLEVVFSLVD